MKAFECIECICMHNEGGGVSSRSASHNFSLRLHDITNQRSALVIVDKEPFTITIRAAIEATNFGAHMAGGT